MDLATTSGESAELASGDSNDCPKVGVLGEVPAATSPPPQVHAELPEHTLNASCDPSFRLPCLIKLVVLSWYGFCGRSNCFILI